MQSYPAMFLLFLLAVVALLTMAARSIYLGYRLSRPADEDPGMHFFQNSLPDDATLVPSRSAMPHPQLPTTRPECQAPR